MVWVYDGGRQGCVHGVCTGVCMGLCMGLCMGVHGVYDVCLSHTTSDHTPHHTPPHSHHIPPPYTHHTNTQSAHTTPGLLLLASSPVGPITWTLTDAHLSHALTTQDVSKGAVLRLRTQATDRGPGGREGGGLGEEGGIGMGGGEEGMGRQSSMSSSVGGSVGGGGGGGGGGVGDATQFGGGGARMLANTISLAGLSRDDQLKKYVVVHVKLHRGQGGGGGHAGGASRHTAASSKGGGVQTTSGTSSTTAMKALPHSLVHNLVVVVITLCTMWLLQGAPTHAAVASIQTLLLVIAGVCGYTYVSSSTTTRGVGGDGRGAGETETAGGGVVKGVGGGVQGGQGGVQWTIEILHAAVTQGVPDEPGVLCDVGCVGKGGTRGEMYTCHLCASVCVYM